MKQLFVIAFGLGLSGFTAYFALNELYSLPAEPLHYSFEDIEKENMKVGLKLLTETLEECRETITFNKKQYDDYQRRTELENRNANRLRNRIAELEAQNQAYRDRIIKQSEAIKELQEEFQ